MGSPAIDAGDPTTCDAVVVDHADQQATPRPIGPVCEIGAIETEGAAEAEEEEEVPSPGSSENKIFLPLIIK